LSPLYARVGNELFFNASPVANKFHIIRSLMEACQDVRVRLRQDMHRDRRSGMGYQGQGFFLLSDEEIFFLAPPFNISPGNGWNFLL
jgi:hypothetical protein